MAMTSPSIMLMTDLTFMIGTKHTIQLKERLAGLYLPSAHTVGFWSQSGVQGFEHVTSRF